MSEVYKGSNTPIYMPQSPNATAGGEQAQIGQAIKDISTEITQMITQQQTVQADQLMMEAKYQTQLSMEQLRIKYSGDPTNENFLNEGRKIYDENMQSAISKSGRFVKQQVKDIYEADKKQNDFTMAMWQFQQGNKVSEQKLKDLLKLQNDQAYQAGRSSNASYIEKMHENDNNFRLQLKNIYGDFAIEEKIEAITNDKIAMYASGLLEANPSVAKSFISSNKKAIGEQVADRLIELAGQRIVSLERWNTTKEAVAGDKLYRDALNNLYEGKTTIADAYNFIEANPQLSHQEKEFFIKTANNTWEEINKAKREKITTEMKALAQNDLNDLYNIVASSDSETVENNLKVYSKFLNEYLTNNLLTREQYQEYSQKITPFENDVLQNNYADQYDRKRALSFDYTGAKKVKQLADDIFYNDPAAVGGIAQNIAKTGRIAYSIMNYLTPNYNSKFNSEEKINEFIKARVNKVNNVSEDDQKDDLYYKTNKFAIGFTNYVYKNMTVGMDELIKKEAEDRKVNFEEYKQSLNSNDLERRQNLVLETLSKRYILENTTITEKRIDEVGYKNLLKQQAYLQRQNADRELLTSKANKKIFSVNNLRE